MDDRMTMRRLESMNRHWHEYPPVHITLVKLFASGAAAEKPASTDEFHQFMDGMGGSLNTFN